MMKLISLIFFCVYFHSGNAEDYKVRYLEGMENGLACHPGYSYLSQRLMNAADKCAIDRTVSSFLCYVTCVYTQLQYITPGEESELDYGMGMYVTSEIFDMDTKAGRASYFKISQQRYECGRDHIVHNNVKFPKSFDNPEACLVAEEFFKCSWKNLFCDTKKWVDFREKKANVTVKAPVRRTG